MSWLSSGSNKKKFALKNASELLVSYQQYKWQRIKHVNTSRMIPQYELLCRIWSFIGRMWKTNVASFMGIIIHCAS